MSAAFVVSLVHFVAMYHLRVPIKFGQMLGSVPTSCARSQAKGQAPPPAKQ